MPGVIRRERAPSPGGGSEVGCIGVLGREPERGLLAPTGDQERQIGLLDDEPRWHTLGLKVLTNIADGLTSEERSDNPQGIFEGRLALTCRPPSEPHLGEFRGQVAAAQPHDTAAVRKPVDVRGEGREHDGIPV